MRKRWVYIDGEAVEVGEDYVNRRESTDTHNIIPDIKPYQSMIDGREITSRSKHRAHLKAHGCIEVGNETKYINQTKGPLAPPPGLKQTIVEIAAEKLRR